MVLPLVNRQFFFLAISWFRRSQWDRFHGLEVFSAGALGEGRFRTCTDDVPEDALNQEVALSGVGV